MGGLRYPVPAGGATACGRSNHNFGNINLLAPYTQRLGGPRAEAAGVLSAMRATRRRMQAEEWVRPLEVDHALDSE